MAERPQGLFLCRSKHTFSTHAPSAPSAPSAPGKRGRLCTLRKANAPAAPAAEAGGAGLTGGAGVRRHHRDAAPGGHGARHNLASRGGATREAPTGDSTAGAADACGERGDTEGSVACPDLTELGTGPRWLPHGGSSLLFKGFWWLTTQALFPSASQPF